MEGFVGTELRPFVADEQGSIDEEDIGFDAAEAVFERIEEGCFLEVIVVRMRPGQGWMAGCGFCGIKP